MIFRTRFPIYGLATLTLISFLLISSPFEGLASSLSTSMPVPTQTPTSSGLSSPDYDMLLAKAQTKRVRIIITLNLPTYTSHTKLSPANKQLQVNRINTLQNRVLRRLSQQTYTLILKSKIFPILVIEADQQALAVLRNSPDIAHVKEDVPHSPSDAASNAQIGAPAAWTQGYDGTGWTIVIMDSGVQTSHPFLSGKVIDEACFSLTSASDGATTVCPNGKSMLPNGTPGQVGPGSGVNPLPCNLNSTGTDIEGISSCDHGTHVAGIALGKTYPTGSNADGVGRGATLISIQIFSRYDTQAQCGDTPVPCLKATGGTEIAAVEYIISTLLPKYPQIAAVNMSFGGGEYKAACDSQEPAWDTLLSTLNDAGIASIVATGNEGYKDAINSPACVSSAISVAAADNEDVADFSNIAPFMSLYAPGVKVNSSVPVSAFFTEDGTSMAAPQVAGAWAILKQCNSGATVNQILTALQDSGPSITSDDDDITKTRIQIDSALGKLKCPVQVVNTINDDPNGVCPSTSNCTLRNAVAQAQATPGTTVVFDPNVFGNDAQSISLNGSISIDSGRIVIQGLISSNIELNSIGNSASFPIFSVKSGATLSIANLNIKSAQGINNAGTLIVNNSEFTNNISASNATGGGAIYNTGTLLINHGDFENNKSGNNASGGAIYSTLNTTVRINNSTFTQNSAGFGGAIGLNKANAVISNSTFTSNTALSGGGGGIYNLGAGDGNLTINNSTFNGNNALLGAGGGIANYFSVTTINNSTFNGNNAKSGGALLSVHNMTVNNSTIVDNMATDTGGGLSASTLNYIGSSIIANNRISSSNPDYGPNIYTGGGIAINSLGNNLLDNPGGTSGFVSTDILMDANPHIASLADNGGPTQTMALYSGDSSGAAVGNGNCTLNNVADVTDQRGIPRKPKCDVGAYETTP